MTRYFIAQDGRKDGPYTLEEARQRTRPGTLVWRQGLAEWCDVAGLAELGGGQIPPPLPPDLISTGAATSVSEPGSKEGSGGAESRIFVLKKVGIRENPTEGINVASLVKDPLAAITAIQHVVIAARFDCSGSASMAPSLNKPAVRRQGKSVMSGSVATLMPSPDLPPTSTRETKR